MQDSLDEGFVIVAPVGGGEEPPRHDQVNGTIVAEMTSSILSSPKHSTGTFALQQQPSSSLPIVTDGHSGHGDYGDN